LIAIKVASPIADVDSNMIPEAPLQLFTLYASADLGAAVAAALDCPVAAHEEREFEDGEHKARPLDDVAGRDVFVMHSLHGEPGNSANDKLCRLLFFIGALKDAGAGRVTAVTPYLCYARKDRRTKPNDPVTTRYIGAMFESMGVDCVVTLEVHSPTAFENAFRCRTVALTGTPLFVDYVKAKLANERLAVVSPDAGGMKRAEMLREALETTLKKPIGKGLAEKHRSSGVVSGELFTGDVSGTTALIVDDLISTGGTLLRTAKAARAAGAQKVIALVTHGLFMHGSAEVIADPALDGIVVSDAVPPFRLDHPERNKKLTLLPSAPLLADAIRRLHENRGLTDLMVF
jgi:ribose-phosphate pyrophosphokinase